MFDFRLRFPVTELQFWASRYQEEKDPILRLVPQVKQRGFLERDEFLEVCRWKSPRSQPRCRLNSGSFVREVTTIALSTPEERLRIEVLTLLTGVSWPTASVVLHLFHAEPYPILDFRALWSLGKDVPKQYDFQFWQKYVAFCRSLARKAALSMRTLDRALWQYSKEKQV